MFNFPDGVIVKAYVVKDPKLREVFTKTTGESRHVCYMNLVWRNTYGPYREESHFLQSVSWGSLARQISHNIKKGDYIVCTGSPKVNTWKFSNNVNFWIWKIWRVNDVDLMLEAGENPEDYKDDEEEINFYDDDETKEE